MAGLTLDAGPIIAWERQDRLVEALVDESMAADITLSVPAPVVAEVWRGGPRSARLARFLELCVLDVLDVETAKAAGVLMARAGSAHTVDALVVASAARRGDRVLTADPGDMTPLAEAAGVELRAF